jgi:hypothetical protein
MVQIHRRRCPQRSGGNGESAVVEDVETWFRGGEGWPSQKSTLRSKSKDEADWER